MTTRLLCTCNPARTFTWVDEDCPTHGRESEEAESRLSEHKESRVSSGAPLNYDDPEVLRRERNEARDLLEKCEAELHQLRQRVPVPLPLNRTEAGYPRCATCDGGGCPDCTDPA